MALYVWIDPDAGTPARIGLTCVSNHDSGPYARGTDIYTVLQNDTGALLTAWKSTDKGATWTAMDAANGPVPTPDSANPDYDTAWYGTDSDGTKIYVIYYTGSDPGGTGGNVMTFQAFDMSTDTWGTLATITTLTPFSFGSPEDTFPTGVFYIPSTAALIVVYQIASAPATREGGIVAVDTSGTLLSGPTAINAGAGFLLRASLSESSGQYWVNTFGTGNNQQDIYHQSISETYTLGSQQHIGQVGTSPLWVDSQPASSSVLYTGHPDPPFSANGEIFFPCYVRAKVGLVGSAHDGWLITVFRGTIMADPVWTVDVPQEVYSITPNVFPNPPVGPYQANGPIQQVFGTDGTTYPVHLCAFVDEHGDIGIFAMNEGAPQNMLRSDYTGIGPDFWTDVIRVADTNDVNQFFWPGQFQETYYSTHVVAQGLDLVMGRDFIGPDGVGQKASTRLMVVRAVGNFWSVPNAMLCGHGGNCWT